MDTDSGKRRRMKTVLEAIKSDSILTEEGVPYTEEELKEQFNVKITGFFPYINVDLAPRSGEGHDYMFRINIVTGKVEQNSIAIGEVIPMSRDEI